MTCAAPDNGAETNWGQLFISEDADAIWCHLYRLVRSAVPDSETDYDVITQDLFLRLMAEGHFAKYSDEEYSQDEINLALVALLN